MTLTLLWRPWYLANVNRRCLASLVKSLTGRNHPASFHLWPLQVRVSPSCQTSMIYALFGSTKAPTAAQSHIRATCPPFSPYQSLRDCTSAPGSAYQREGQLLPTLSQMRIWEEERCARAPLSPRKPAADKPAWACFFCLGARAPCAGMLFV